VPRALEGRALESNPRVRQRRAVAKSRRTAKWLLVIRFTVDRLPNASVIENERPFRGKNVGKDKGGKTSLTYLLTRIGLSWKLSENIDHLVFAQLIGTSVPQRLLGLC